MYATYSSASCKTSYKVQDQAVINPLHAPLDCDYHKIISTDNLSTHPYASPPQDSPCEHPPPKHIQYQPLLATKTITFKQTNH